MYNPRIRAYSEVLQPISQYQADIRRRLSGPTGVSDSLLQLDKSEIMSDKTFWNIDHHKAIFSFY